MPVDGVPVRIVLGQIPPAAACLHHVKYRVDDIPFGVFWHSPPVVLLLEEDADQRPFRVIQVRVVHEKSPLRSVSSGKINRIAGKLKDFILKQLLKLTE